jgi:hypothetical protein
MLRRLFFAAAIAVVSLGFASRAEACWLFGGGCRGHAVSSCSASCATSCSASPAPHVGSGRCHAVAVPQPQSQQHLAPTFTPVPVPSSTPIQSQSRTVQYSGPVVSGGVSVPTFRGVVNGVNGGCVGGNCPRR